MLSVASFPLSPAHRLGSLSITFGSTTRPRITGRRWHPCRRNADHRSPRRLEARSTLSEELLLHRARRSPLSTQPDRTLQLGPWKSTTQQPTVGERERRCPRHEITPA